MGWSVIKIIFHVSQKVPQSCLLQQINARTMFLSGDFMETIVGRIVVVVPRANMIFGLLNILEDGGMSLTSRIQLAPESKTNKVSEINT